MNLSGYRCADANKTPLVKGIQQVVAVTLTILPPLGGLVELFLCSNLHK